VVSGALATGVTLDATAADAGEACGETPRSGAAVAGVSATGAFELRLPFTATIDLAMLRATVGYAHACRQEINTKNYYEENK
jgi:hypothetical protein